jgi:hypothetical protein
VGGRTHPHLALLTTADLRHTPRVAAFFDAIGEEIETLRPTITG